MSREAQDMLPVEPTDSRFIPAACSEEQANYLTAFYENFAASGNQPDSVVRYWDPSTAILMLDAFEGKTRSICSSWEEIQMQVNLIPGAQYAWTVQSEHGLDASVCTTADVTAFKERFFSTGCATSPDRAEAEETHTRP